jgi:hypothetical protein
MKYEKRTFAAALMAGALLIFTRGIFAQETGYIRELSGTVETKAPGSALWVNALVGDRIGRDTLISTGFKSSAALVLGESVIMVRPLTRLSVEEIEKNQEGEQVNLYLQTGRIRAEVNLPSGGKIDFTVRSPIATASVRGTSFDFDTENLRVDEGQVQYSLANGRVILVAGGETSYVDEANNRVLSPFVAALELLSPALPPGSDSGNPGSVNDRAPALTLPPGLARSSGIDTGIDFEWD